MPDLKSMVGKEITALVPLFDKTEVQKFKLHGVETAGIWVESQSVTNVFLEKVGVQTAPKTMIFLLPWHQIAFIWDSVDVPSLSEKGFGI
jgi:hypothetical protein